jgi:hypothetical protein
MATKRDENYISKFPFLVFLHDFMCIALSSRPACSFPTGRELFINRPGRNFPLRLNFSTAAMHGKNCER